MWFFLRRKLWIFLEFIIKLSAGRNIHDYVVVNIWTIAEKERVHHKINSMIGAAKTALNRVLSSTMLSRKRFGYTFEHSITVCSIIHNKMPQEIATLVVVKGFQHCFLVTIFDARSRVCCCIFLSKKEK